MRRSWETQFLLREDLRDDLSKDRQDPRNPLVLVQGVWFAVDVEMWEVAVIAADVMDAVAVIDRLVDVEPDALEHEQEVANGEKGEEVANDGVGEKGDRKEVGC